MRPELNISNFAIYVTTCIHGGYTWAIFLEVVHDVFFISLFVGTWTPLVPIRHRDIIANMTSNSFIAAVIRANKMLKCYLGAS